MKKLYLLTRNNGDGSTSIEATFDESIIDEIENKYDNDELDFETWVDGDGFHYKTLTVPDECTPESMGFIALTHNEL